MIRRLLFASLLANMLANAQYAAEQLTVDGMPVVRLADARTRTEVRIAPKFGHNAYSMTVNGHELFWRPGGSLGDWKAKPTLAGNPFLWPWANRIDGDSYYAGGQKFHLNDELGNLRRDGNRKPIHGLLIYSADWEETVSGADADSAWATSKFHYSRFPALMAQFPFAHTVTMTYRLRGGDLEVETVIENQSNSAMPVAVGYHPYFQLTDAPRDDWKVHIAAKDAVVLGPMLTPTGETKPHGLADPMSLRGTQLDNVFVGLVRDAAGRASFWVQGKEQKLTVEYGPNYPVAVIYAPAGRNFICFEPMAGVTNVFNLAQEGKFPVQTVAAGAIWRESYWIRPSGF